MARSTVAVRFTGDVSSLKSSLGDVEGRMKGLGGKLAGIGKAVAAGLAGTAVAAGAFAKSAIDSASNLEETLSKSNTVFGDQAKAIEDWAGSAAKNIGQSKQQALEAASTFGNMFTQLGIGEKDAAGMSKQMTELASDFASFHNADISDVLDAQAAAFRGEYDALQRFVPTINAAAVEQKALEQTGKKTTKELTAQEKAIATQTLMLEGAGDAMGDFDRTSDSLANKQRIMSARFEDVKAKIGQGLLPIVTKIAAFIADTVIPVFERWGPKVTEVVQQIAAVVAEKWPQIQAVILNAVTAVRDAVTPIIAALQALWQKFGDNILSFVQRVWPNIQQIIEAAMNIIRGVIQTVTSLIRGDWSGVWNGLKAIVSGVWNAIQGIVKGAIEGVRAVVGAGLEVVGSIFKSAWNGIVDFFRGVPGRISSTASGMFDGIKNAFKSALNWIIRGWNSLEFKIPGFDPPGPGPKFGGFTLGVPNIPTLHTGGVYEAPTPGGEGLALLKDGERVLSPSESRRFNGRQTTSTGPAIHIENVHLGNGNPRDLADELAWMWRLVG